ncbi:MAG: aminodeoxychorismate synthase component I [Hyphomicrobium sp.]|jgi:para-aminobenzoate synthetase component 1
MDLPIDAPGSSFLDMAEACSGEPEFVFLDAQGDHPGWGMSMFAFAPVATIVARSDETTVRKCGVERRSSLPVLESIEEELRPYRLDLPDGQAHPHFVGGAVGYLAYELGRQLEVLPSSAVNDLRLPTAYFNIYNFAVCYDHQSGRCRLAYVDGFPSDAPTREAILRRLESASATPRVAAADWRGRFGAITSDLSKAEYLDALSRIKEYIRSGDVYQVNMTQRFRAPLGMSPWSLWRRLAAINPAPFAAYLNLDEHSVISSSPELFLRVRGDRVETRPIKGTIRRSADSVEDAMFARELLGSAKNNAELAMIVDLMRNDLGRVAMPGTVEVEACPVLETYPSVHHLVATVAGRRDPSLSLSTLLRATFPGGSITGAPKIRAMEIIDELEPVARGVYTGSIGYISCHGTMDLNIAIRTVIVKGDTAYFHAGGGVVADSEPEQEYEELLLKASRLAQALTADGPVGTESPSGRLRSASESRNPSAITQRSK